ncbi:MAG: hypothetical protein A2096_07425 [Spirochaetes bacterium GWF1_41_5]|nr:MAG: hypothetical protein A2096_07425 [Spirochaetes bacterium GWF1_41_5]HBE01968.1 hypothetical protein [Spirochaetia bacterium]
MPDFLQITQKCFRYLNETLDTKLFYGTSRANIPAPKPASSVSVPAQTGQQPISVIPVTELKTRIQNCQQCLLAVKRKKFTDFGGPKNNQAVFISDFPSYFDEKQGALLSDRSGEQFDKILSALKINRRLCYITSCLKCAAPSEPGENLSELMVCRKYLEEEIHFLEPKLIIGLGSFTFRFCFPGADFMQKRGQKMEFCGYPIWFTWHPKDMIIDSRLKKPAWDDLQRIFGIN